MDVPKIASDTVRVRLDTKVSDGLKRASGRLHPVLCHRAQVQLK